MFSSLNDAKKETAEKVKIYFASDLHLGIADSEKREKIFVDWLDMAAKDATAIYLLGDLFDFWFEYKTVVPRGYVRLLGKLAELRAANIPIYYFVGNHDLWMNDYFEKELDIPIFWTSEIRYIAGKHFFIGHGDGLGPKDTKYKILKKIFTNPFCKWAFSWIHPNIAIGIANYFSQKSRAAHGESDNVFLGKKKEMLYQYCQRKYQQLPHIDYFVFGHRHLPLDIVVDDEKNATNEHTDEKHICRYINLGDWIKHYSYATFDGQTLQIQYFRPS